MKRYMKENTAKLKWHQAVVTSGGSGAARPMLFLSTKLTNPTMIAERRVADDAPAQATLRSAMSTFPFVSGLKRTATRKMAKPTTVVTKIGPDKPIWLFVA